MSTGLLSSEVHRKSVSSWLRLTTPGTASSCTLCLPSANCGSGLSGIPAGASRGHKHEATSAQNAATSGTERQESAIAVQSPFCVLALITLRLAIDSGVGRQLPVVPPQSASVPHALPRKLEAAGAVQVPCRSTT